jgi:hypothetical protein
LSQSSLPPSKKTYYLCHSKGLEKRDFRRAWASGLREQGIGVKDKWEMEYQP